MRVLGIDPGTRHLGWGVVERNGTRLVHVAHGVIDYPLKALGLCASLTGARYTTTTEVYPDSPRATPEQCDRAQVAAVRAALDYALAHG